MPTPKPSGTKIPGIQAKRNIRIQQIARYRITGRLTDAQIAAKVGLTPSGLAQILMLPEYKDLEDSLLEGHISQMDEALAGNIDELKATMETAVPLALRTLVETVQQRRDLRAAMSAAKEILDRDPERTFTAASKAVSTMSPGQEFNPGTADASMIASLAQNAAKVIVEIKTAPVQTKIEPATLPPEANQTPGSDGLGGQE